MHPMSWLEKTAPGFDQLNADERAAIRDFLFLWSFYEGTALNTSGGAAAIVADVNRLKEAGKLNLDSIAAPIEYFLSRYFNGNGLTYAYSMLHLRQNDMPHLVEAVLRKQSQDVAQILSAILIIVLRLRNNLFHGEKWAYGIKDQLNNFRNANAILMAVMDMH
jgi:hypothetical protein